METRALLFLCKNQNGVNCAADDVPDNWNFNGGNPCLHHGGNYDQNLNHGPFYVNYNRATNTNDNIGCRFLASNRLTLHLVVRGPHPFYIVRLTAQLLLKMSRQDTA